MKLKIWVALMKLGRLSGCHQRPDRSFFIKGYQFPVCMRCTGILVGGFTALIFHDFLAVKWWMLFLLCVPMAVDGSIQLMGYWESTNWSRMLTGFLAGIGSMALELKLALKIIRIGEYI